MRLRTEQERTKQEFYRLEIASKNFGILQSALRAQIPPHLIPRLFREDEKPESKPQESSRPSSISRTTDVFSRPQDPRPAADVPTSAPMSASASVPSASPRSRGHSRTSSLLENTLNASVVPPQNFRFGGPLTSSRRPHSPAKIGAAAVANLATPVTPYRTRRSQRYHQRHYSMPVELAKPRSQEGNYESKVTEGSSEEGKVDKSKTSPVMIQSTPSLTPTNTGSSVQNSPTMQVKPAPALPLHKQTKQPPLQELMTSFQHIIQFHHWKPESPSVTPFRHKRHKSDMLIDLGLIETSTPLQGGESRDRTMDLEETTILERDETSSARPPSDEQGARYPHDILQKGK